MSFLGQFIIAVLLIYPFSGVLYAQDECCSHGHYKCQTIELLKNRKAKKLHSDRLQEDFRIPMQSKFPSQAGYFVIHFDTVGVNKVDLTDMNQNGVPDYVDSVAFYFDVAYEFLVNQLGYNPPPPDSGFGGDDRYDIHIVNLVAEDYAIYGYTEAELDINPPLKHPRHTSSIYIDNDYSPFDSIKVANGNKIPAYAISGINAVKITSVHELHHAIQFGYGYPDDDGIAFMEMSSTWLESELYPELNNYLAYIGDLFKSLESFPLSEANNAQTGYRWNVFFKYLSEAYSPDLIRDFWKFILEEQAPFEALYSSIETNNLDYNDVWTDFLSWIYHTNTRSIGDTYFAEAARFPRLTINLSENMTSDIFEIVELLQPYQFMPIRVNNLSGSDKGITHFDFIIGKIQPMKVTDELSEFKLKINKNEESQIPYSIFKYKIDADKGDIISAVFVNDGARYPEESFVLPNPVDLTVDDFFIAVPLLIANNLKYNIMIYDPNYMVVVDKNIEPSRSNGYTGFRIDLADNSLASGVYLYSISGNDKSFFGKFAITKKK
ncbi:MAG: DUF6055 domain-containing protein [Candidatus Kapabacteria bacterium]|nr:DUF6055 domain-containing protein [Candidatus Kapabacteria bacterium]